MTPPAIHDLPDPDLLTRSAAGDRDAFGALVQRHQAYICALAYSLCGNLAASQDVAQDTFVTAWQKLPGLRDPARFKAWLAGITRNLALNLRRADSRRTEVLSSTRPTVGSSPAPPTQPTPDETLIRREEEALVWQVLEELPESARLPLILFYRENHSIPRVAELLDLSEDAVKQRLSRGRNQLRDHLAARVETALSRSAPGAVFTVGVLAALPMVAAPSAAAASAAAAKGAAAATGTFGLSTVLLLLGPVLGALGGWIGYRASLRQAGSVQEAAFIRRFSRWLIGWVIFNGGLFAAVLILARRILMEHPIYLAWIIPAWLLLYLVGTTALVVWGTLRMTALRKETLARDPAPRSQANDGPLGWHYRSPWTFLGLPLIHICGSRRENGIVRRGLAVGWIAIGDLACGILFAAGGAAVGGIAVGGGSLGVVSLGGLAFGALALGGLSLGGLAFGGFAVGWLAFGGAAFGWEAAQGGLAVARHYAVGGAVSALHANDAVARSWLDSHPFSRRVTAALPHLQWISFLSLLPIVPALVSRWRESRRPPTQPRR